MGSRLISGLLNAKPQFRSQMHRRTQLPGFISFLPQILGTQQGSFYSWLTSMADRASVMPRGTYPKALGKDFPLGLQAQTKTIRGRELCWAQSA
jgi:hypothetical protein